MTTSTAVFDVAACHQPHDHFGRKVIIDVLIATDLINLYATPSIARYINLANLKPVTTQHFGQAFKEYFSDSAQVAHLANDDSEVLFTLEFKSRPAAFVALQLLLYAVLSLYDDYKIAGRPESKNGKFKMRIPIMVLIYNGTEDIDEEIWFQDIFDNIPEELRQLVPNFRVLVVNLRKFGYGQLRGRPETQAVVEAMKRATDGTFAENITHVIGHLQNVPLDDRIRDLIRDVVTYSASTSEITIDQIDNAITTTIKGHEEKNMMEKNMMEKNMILSTTKSVRSIIAENVLESMVDNVLAILETRFKQEVPANIANELRSRVDLVAMRSLVVHAVTCESMDDFAKSLQ